jgi:hypothetical protein
LTQVRPGFFIFLCSSGNTSCYFSAPTSKYALADFERGVMAPPAQTTEGTLRSLRILHFVLLVSMGLYVYVLRIIPAPPPREIKPIILPSMTLYAAALLAVAFVLRWKRIQPAFETLRSRPADQQSLQGWRVGSIVGADMAESIAVIGFAIHLLGATVAQTAAFFVVGIASMLFWWPRRP